MNDQRISTLVIFFLILTTFSIDEALMIDVDRTLGT